MLAHVRLIDCVQYSGVCAVEPCIQVMHHSMGTVYCVCAVEPCILVMHHSMGTVYCVCAVEPCILVMHHSMGTVYCVCAVEPCIQVMHHSMGTVYCVCAVEPCILVMHHSMRPHPAITATLLDFMCRVSPLLSPSGWVSVEIATSHLQMQPSIS